MKPLSTLVFTAVLLLITVAQINSQQLKTQKEPPLGYIEIPNFHKIIKLPYGCSHRGSGIVKEKELVALKSDLGCKDILGDLNIDQQTLSAIYYTQNGDCHADFKHKLFKNDLEKKYKMFANIFYGGCAGLKIESYIALTDKLDDSFEFEYVPVRRGYKWDLEDKSDFLFPKTRSTLPAIEVSARIIDVSNCLKLDGNSQWIIQKQEFLLKAIENSLDVERCTEHFQKLNIDLEKEILVGKTIIHDRCFVPQVATFEVLDDQPNEELTFELAYTFDKQKSCYQAAFAPIWLVIDKPEGYRQYIFNTRSN